MEKVLLKLILPEGLPDHFDAIADRIRVLIPVEQREIDQILGEVEEVLDKSIGSKSYTIDRGEDYKPVDLSQVEQRHVRENLSEDELALFDLIIRETLLS